MIIDTRILKQGPGGRGYVGGRIFKGCGLSRNLGGRLFVGATKHTTRAFYKPLKFGEGHGFPERNVERSHDKDCGILWWGTMAERANVLCNQVLVRVLSYGCSAQHVRAPNPNVRSTAPAVLGCSAGGSTAELSYVYSPYLVF